MAWHDFGRALRMPVNLSIAESAGIVPGAGCTRLHVCALTLLSVLTTLLAGCSILQNSSEPPKAEVKTLQGKNEPLGSTSITALQSEVMRFADAYAATVAQATDDSIAASTNDETRVAGLKWKLEQANAAYVNAANRNPILNALDMIVLATLSRMVVETRAATPQTGVSLSGLLEAHRQLETNAWSVVDRVLKEPQKRELQQILTDWRKKNPTQRYVGGIRFREFAIGVGAAPESKKNKPTSVFNLLFIDPMASLDPTGRAIEETRQSAERITYYAQRAPLLLSWQLELLTYELAAQPAGRQLLADAHRLSASAEVFARTADQLPKLVDQQREAAIKQLLDGVAAERTNLLASLGSEEQKITGLL